MALEVTELSIKRKNVKIILSTSWAECSFRLAIVFNGCVWVGEASSELISGFSSSLGMDIVKYVETLKCALTGERNAEFTFNFVKGLFICEKKVKRIRMTFGKFKLKKCSGMDVTIGMIREAFISNFHFRQQVQNLLNENISLKEELSCISGKLETCIKKKENMENELFNRFQLIINEKKKKISDLSSDSEKGIISPDEYNSDTLEIVEEKVKNDKFDFPELSTINYIYPNVPLRKEVQNNCSDPGPSKTPRLSF